MPFAIRKRKCLDSKGNNGNYIVYNKETGKKVSCHKTKEEANKAKSIRERKSNDS